MSDLLADITTTEEVQVPTDPFQQIIGQDHAVMLVKSAVIQRRHVLLCGVPGIGKSLLAKAASTLLPPPREEIRIQPNPSAPNRPIAVIHTSNIETKTEEPILKDMFYVRPEELPFDVAVEMGYRCPQCGSISSPDQGSCLDCGAAKRCEWTGDNSYHGLFRVLDVIHERAELVVTRHEEQPDGTINLVTYQRDKFDTIRVSVENAVQSMRTPEYADEYPIVPLNTSRFIRVSGASAVELLGDVKHDPYGSAESLGVPPHRRIIPGAIHEAHEGILYIDELATLGPLQKHLLTAMQDKRYSIIGHNPHSSGASVRVDNVPCDFILFASTNLEDLPGIIPPLRSRIRGYGYEIVLNAWMKKTPDAVDNIVQFVAQTVHEDGKIAHFTVEAVKEIVNVAEQMAQELDGQSNALTLRLRELGGVIRIAGDLAVQDSTVFVDTEHVKRARKITHQTQIGDIVRGTIRSTNEQDYGSYFF
ncbi:MAG: ATP-binding protein [Candidatus Thorarchaeota archaeon]|nr:ATP-binding protein [Candidatus Thorarchaeota archaeon]